MNEIGGLIKRLRDVACAFPTRIDVEFGEGVSRDVIDAIASAAGGKIPGSLSTFLESVAIIKNLSENRVVTGFSPSFTWVFG